MSQEPVNIMGVVAFPNENGQREIRFIDSEYNNLFTVPDGGNIILTHFDGKSVILPCRRYQKRAMYLIPMRFIRYRMLPVQTTVSDHTEKRQKPLIHQTISVFTPVCMPKTPLWNSCG